ncbi:MAG: AAA family ATPase [Chlamydiales bacterium]|nr:AAA family ATPase [Chlamydiales bacterium]
MEYVGGALSLGWSALSTGVDLGVWAVGYGSNSNTVAGPCDIYSRLNPHYYLCQITPTGIAPALSDLIAQVAIGTFEKLGEAVDQGKLKIDPSKWFEGLGGAANKSGVGLIDGLNIPGLFDRVFQDLGDVSSRLRAVAYKEMDGLVVDIQNLFGSAVRGTVFRVLPWVAIGTALTVGTPLTVLYLYRKAVYNIGRPTLASEVRKTGLVHKIAGKVSTVTKFVFKKAIPTSILTSVVLAAGICLENNKSFLERNFPSGDFADALWFTKNLFGPRALQDTAIATAAISAAGLVAFDAFKALIRKRPFKTEVIFAPKITQKVEDIADATCNLMKNGGFFQNVLFYGPGGTGKTELARKIAERSNMDFIMISGGDLAKYIGLGTHVTVVNELFDKITRPTVLFIDEFENLAKRRQDLDRSQLHEVLNAFLSRTGTPSKKVMIVAATNLEETIDSAVLSRMDHKIFIGPPGVEERRKIQDMYLKQFFPNSKERALYFDSIMMTKLLYQTEGLTGRALFKLFNMLAQKKYSMNKGAFTPEVIQECVSSFVDQELKNLPILQRVVRAAKLFVAYSFEMQSNLANQTRERLNPKTPPVKLSWYDRTIGRFKKQKASPIELSWYERATSRFKKPQTPPVKLSWPTRAIHRLKRQKTPPTELSWHARAKDWLTTAPSKILGTGVKK